jgi:hypothetical protein
MRVLVAALGASDLSLSHGDAPVNDPFAPGSQSGIGVLRRRMLLAYRNHLRLAERNRRRVPRRVFTRLTERPHILSFSLKSLTSQLRAGSEIPGRLQMGASLQNIASANKRKRGNRSFDSVAAIVSAVRGRGDRSLTQRSRQKARPASFHYLGSQHQSPRYTILSPRLSSRQPNRLSHFRGVVPVPPGPFLSSSSLR